MTESTELENFTVSKVCQDFRVREDGALANRLQEEEFQKHYGFNRDERRNVRGDLIVAKKTYLEEVKTAHLLPQDELQQMEETDKWLAKELQDRLHEEEQRDMLTKSELEKRDAQIAKDLQEREKQKLDRARQRKRELEIQAEQETRHLFAVQNEQAREGSRDRPRDSPRERPDDQYRDRDRPRERHQDPRDLDYRPRDPQDRPREEYRGRDDLERVRGRQERGREPYRERPEERERGRHRENDRGRDGYRGRQQDDDRERPQRQERPREQEKPREQERPGEQDRPREGYRDAQDERERERPREREQRPRESRPRDANQGRPREQRQPQEEPSESRAEPERQKGRREQRREAHLQGYQWDPKWERYRGAPNGNTDSVGRHSASSSTGSEDESKKTTREEGMVVAMPPLENGGGRLETDRIIMADGTAIALFDNEEERQKALKREREKKDEELAKMLQEQERKISEAEKMATQDKKIAVEEQDREFAKHLQRKEYQRAQQLHRERQIRRANSTPGDRSSSLEDTRRLPSYQEAVHRRQMPDLLQDQDCIVDCEVRGRGGTSQSSSDSSQGSHPSSLERGYEKPPSRQTEPDQRPSPNTSLERSNEHNPSSRSSYASSGQESCERTSQAGSPTSRADVWERLYEAEDDEEFERNTQSNRPVGRSRTVATSNPSNYNSADRRLPYNVVEGIDPTFKRPPKREGTTKEEDGDAEKAKVIPLIKPHRRRSGDRKKNRENNENCKQQ